MNSDYLVCRLCGRYFNSVTGKPIGSYMITEIRNRDKDMCRECADESMRHLREMKAWSPGE
jgi:hypothetical protein